MTPPPLPVPKPRARYLRDSRSSASSLEAVTDETLTPLPSNGVQLSTDDDAPPLPPPLPSPGVSHHDVFFPSLAGVSDIIATSIPPLAGVLTTIGGSAPTAASAPTAPPSVDSIANSIAAQIPDLAETASTVANPTTPPTTSIGAASLDSIVSSLANIPSFSGIINDLANQAVSSSPSTPPHLEDKPHPLSLKTDTAGDYTDVSALSQLVMSTLDSVADVSFPPVEGAEGFGFPPVEGAEGFGFPPVEGAEGVGFLPVEGAGGFGLPLVEGAAGVGFPPVEGAAGVAFPPVEGAAGVGFPLVEGAAGVGFPPVEGAEGVGFLPVEGAAGVGFPLVEGAAGVGFLPVEGAAGVGFPLVEGAAGVSFPPVEGAAGVGFPPVEGAAGVAFPPVEGAAGVAFPPVEGAGGVGFPPVEGAGGVGFPPVEGSKGEDNYVTVLACWTNQEEADSESSNEDQDAGPAPSGSEEPMRGDPTSENSISSNQLPRLVPTRPAPPPPRTAGQSGKSVKQKIPRAATIRVSRKKGGRGTSAPLSAVVRASWLDVWKGFRHNVLWAMLDGQLMSLWKKRTDRFSEVMFHVSSITNVKQQDKGRFSVYFRKKHYDFMAHNNEVQEGWVSSLLASRGQPSPAPPELQGPISIKETRSRAYAAVWGHDLWIYPNKESFQLGIASFSVPLNLATVKTTGKHSFTLITPYRSFSLSVDSSKDLSVWLDSLSSTIRSALSCSQVAQRLWDNPYNKVCGDCGAANPEWASVNLLMVICHECAGQHRALGSNLSKVRSLKMDSKIWTEPLVQLFVIYGNRLANQVWAPAVPAAEQLRPESTDEERSKFIQDKYNRGRYRRVHALTSSHSMMDQRLCQVVCSDDVEETMSLICSGAKVSQSDPQSPSPLLLAERANQALQTELLRLNEYTDVPPHQPQSANRRPDSTPSGEEEEELHGKLEEDRFLFSVENNSAACDVLDLREVLSVFIKDGPAHQFEMVTLSDQLICNADDKEALLSHLVHILKVILPGGVSYAEVGGASAVSKVCVVKVGRASSQSDAWLLLWEDGVSIYPVHRHAMQVLRIELSMLSHHEMDSSENTITMVTTDRSVSLRFEEEYSCQSWFNHLQRALTNQSSAPQRPFVANHSSALYPKIDLWSRGSVPPAIERCISHITAYGLKVEGVYRRCGLAAKVKQLVEVLMTSPNSAPLESHEQGVLDAGSALKQYVRQQERLIPEQDQHQWLQAAVISDERSRFKEYRRLLRQLPDDNRATLNALFGHFYMVQVFSQVNKMSAHNLAVVLVPSVFQVMNQDMIRLTREFIIHHTLLFLTPGGEQTEEEEEHVTVF